MEGQHAMPEVAGGRRVRAKIRFYLDRLLGPQAVPTRRKAGRAEQFPTVSIRYIERQAAVGKALVAGVHPIALERRNTNSQIVTVDPIGDKLRHNLLPRDSQAACALVGLAKAA